MELIDRAKVIADVGNNVANREVSVALLGKGRPAIVGVAGILRRQRNERIGKLSFNVLEVIVSGRQFQAKVSGQFPIHAQLTPVEILVVAREFIRPIGREIEVGVENRKGAADKERGNPLSDFVFSLDGNAIKPKIIVSDQVAAEERVVEPAEIDGKITAAFDIANFIPDKGAIEPNGVAAEIAALTLVGESE